MGGNEAMEVEESVHFLEVKYNEAKSNRDNNPELAIKEFQSILNEELDTGDAEETELVLRMKEQSIYELAKLYTHEKKEKELSTLLQSLRPFFITIPKAKTGKIVRTVIDMVSNIKNENVNVLQLQSDLCRDSIEWCNQEKHTFLRQRIEARLAAVLFEQRKFQEALDLITRLLKEIKKLDDKQLLVEIHLTESRLNHALRNTPKAKSSLTASRSVANSVYISPTIQAQIDMMSGTLQAEEKDYKTSYSYFFEAFEVFHQLKAEEALPSLKYMLLSKIASGNAADVQSIINSKNGLKHAGVDLEALQAVAKAHEKRSLEDFQTATNTYQRELVEDAFISRHLKDLYEQLLESNLLKIIEPFSCVEVDHVANLINLPLAQIETKLSQMILDGKFYGILDQGKGQLIIYDHPPEDKSYKAGLELVDNVGHIVGSLFKRADKLAL